MYVSVYVCVSSVALLHPAKALGQNEMPFDQHTVVVQSNIVLNRVPSPRMGKGDLGVGTLSFQ